MLSTNIYTPGAIYREAPPPAVEHVPCLECSRPMQALIRYNMPTQWRCLHPSCRLSIFKLVKVPSFTEDLNMGIDRFYA